MLRQELKITVCAISRLFSVENLSLFVLVVDLPSLAIRFILGPDVKPSAVRLRTKTGADLLPK
jgi:hypothetical protein